MLLKIEAWAFSRALCRGRAILAGGDAKFFRDLSVLVGGQIAAKLIGFLAFAYLARRLDPEAYGSVEFIIGLAGLFSTMVDLGLGTIGIRRAAAAPGERPLLAAQITIIRFCIAFICAIALLKKGPTPPLSLAARPLTPALALGFCAQALALDSWVGACAALAIYVFSAPFLDRALVSLAHASADSTKRQAP